MTYAKKVDKNHGQIRDDLRALGFQVADTSDVGRGFPDLVVGGTDKCTGKSIIVLIEIKDKNGELTPEQEKFHDYWRGFPVFVARTLGDVLVDCFGWEASEIEQASEGVER